VCSSFRPDDVSIFAHVESAALRIVVEFAGTLFERDDAIRYSILRQGRWFDGGALRRGFAIR
jgi:hypothetical protein